MYLWWSLCTFTLYVYSPTRSELLQATCTLLEFMYLVFTHLPGQSYVPCIYSPTRSEFPQVTCTLVEFMYLVFTHLPGQSYHRWPVLWWSSCTLYLLTYQVRVTTGDLYSGGVHVPCIYSSTRSELLQVTQVIVVVFVWHLLSTN